MRVRDSLVYSAALTLLAQYGCAPGVDIPAASPASPAVAQAQPASSPPTANLASIAPSAPSTANAASPPPVATPSPPTPTPPALDQALASTRKSVAGGDFIAADHALDLAT